MASKSRKSSTKQSIQERNISPPYTGCLDRGDDGDGGNRGDGGGLTERATSAKRAISPSPRPRTPPLSSSRKRK